MSRVSITLDGAAITCAEGATILDAAREAGVSIPTLCHHEKLEPYGGCRLCLVDIGTSGREKLVVSCVYQVEEGLTVRTRTEKIDRVRRTLIELLLARAPESEAVAQLAREYGASRERFERDASFCVHCGLCVRYCAEVARKHAVGFVDRGTRKEIAFVPQVAAAECDACKACFPLCPTSYLQAAYVLTLALAGRSKDRGCETGG
jgi:NADH dehydrogenase/NADH:ubiquinone oxidoreductase subunit G